MPPLRITNTLGGKKEEVAPRNPDGILRVYHCGPTVYSTPHLGNLRRFLVADLLVRVLRFLGYRVRSVMNITDVGHLLDEVTDHASAGPDPTPPSPSTEGLGFAGPDPTSLPRSFAGQDRMLVAAQREGQSPEQIAAKYTAEFFAALASLHAEPADYYPRATMHIPQMYRLIQRLLDRGRAYVTRSGVYLAVTATPGYGKLSGNTLAAVQAVGVRADPTPPSPSTEGLGSTGQDPTSSSPFTEGLGFAGQEKRHPADFALWIFAPKEHLMQWDAPWGRGFPGWHIECSAMSMQVLGERLDMHTGGRDNIFPHHENEIAQSEGATGETFATFWVHNEFLELHEQKMSKSEGKTLTLRNLSERGFDPLAFRLLCLQTHYRSKLAFSWESLAGAVSALHGLREFVARIPRRSPEDVESGPHFAQPFHRRAGLRGAGPHVVQPFHRRAGLRGAGPGGEESVPPVTERLQALAETFSSALADDLGSPQALAALFDFVREMNPRVQAGALGAEEAEAIRATLRKLDKVLALLDVDAPLPSPDAPPEVRKLIADREEARSRQDFTTADRLREDIKAKGFTVEDLPSGQRVIGL